MKVGEEEAVGCLEDGLDYLCWEDIGDHGGEVGTETRLSNSRTKIRIKVDCIRVCMVILSIPQEGMPSSGRKTQICCQL